MVKVAEFLQAQAKHKQGAQGRGQPPSVAQGKFPGVPVFAVGAPPAAIQPPAGQSPQQASKPPTAPETRPMAEVVREQHGINATPQDEPIFVIHSAMALRLDRFEKILSGFGPDAAKQAADSAAFAAKQAVSDGIARVTFQITVIRIIATLFLCATSVALWEAFIDRGVDSRIGYFPDQMASVIHLQDWEAQWKARIPQAPKNGYEWALMPVVVKAPTPPVKP